MALCRGSGGCKSQVIKVTASLQSGASQLSTCILLSPMMSVPTEACTLMKPISSLFRHVSHSINNVSSDEICAVPFNYLYPGSELVCGFQIAKMLLLPSAISEDSTLLRYSRETNDHSFGLRL